MTPINSIDDVRFVTLIGVAMDAIEELALALGKDPEQILSENLYRANKKIHELGEEKYARKLITYYPILLEAIE